MCNFGSESVGKVNVNVNVKELELKKIGCKGKIKKNEAGTWFDEPTQRLVLRYDAKKRKKKRDNQ